MPVRGDYDEPDGSNPAIAEGKTARARRNGAANRRVGGLGKCRGGWSEGLRDLTCPRCGGLCGGRAQENRGGPACTLGKMEEKQAKQVTDIAVCVLVFNALRRSGDHGIYL